MEKCLSIYETCISTQNDERRQFNMNMNFTFSFVLFSSFFAAPGPVFLPFSTFPFVAFAVAEDGGTTFFPLVAAPLVGLADLFAELETGSGFRWPRTGRTRLTSGWVAWVGPDQTSKDTNINMKLLSLTNHKNTLTAFLPGSLGGGAGQTSGSRVGSSNEAKDERRPCPTFGRQLMV